LKVHRGCAVVLNKSRTVTARQYDMRSRQSLLFRKRGLATIFRFRAKPVHDECGDGDDSTMRAIVKSLLVVGAVVLAPGLAAADDFKLSNNQRISCGRGLAAGKLSTATCRSYAYLFNAKTSEYFRCSVSLSMTRDAKEVINVQSDGACVKKPRVFDTDSSYSFDATETEPPNTNSFFGNGGFAMWVSDNTQQKIRGCVTIPSGLGSDVSRCIDMKFE
jgi:hypothetical protein